MNRPERTDQILLVGFLALFSFAVLYAFRALDTNTLTSWQWVFRHAGMFQTLLLIAAVLALASYLASFEPGERSYPLVLAALSFAAAAPLWSEPEVILDASRYFSAAKYLELHGPWSFLREWGGEVSAWTDLPAVPFAYGAIFRSLGESRTAIQMFTTLLFSLAVVSTYRIGRSLLDAETGFLAGMLLLGSPYLLVQVPLMLVDVPTMALLTFSIDAFLTAVLTGGIGRSALAVACVVATVLAKYSAWLMLPVLPLATLVASRRGGGAVIRRSLAILAAASAAGLLLWMAKQELVAAQVGLLRSYQLPGLGRWGERPASTFLFQVHPFIALLASYGVIAAVRSRDLRFLVPCWFSLFVLVFPVERIRYLLPLFPLLALMAAYGLQAAVSDAGVRRFTAFSVAGTSVVLAVFAYLPFLNTTTMANTRDAGRYLDSLPGEEFEVHVLPQLRSIGNTEAAIPLLDLFTGKRLVHRQERHSRPDDGKLRTSPLRFTWELNRPRWYAGRGDDAGRTLVIISSGGDPSPPKAAGKRFEADSGTFRYRTVVTVLERNALARTAQ